MAPPISQVVKLLVMVQISLECSYSVSAYYPSKPHGLYRDIYPLVDSMEALQNCTDRETSRVPLYFGLMMSYGGDVKSSGAIPGVQVALDVINSQSDLLPGYTLHYTLTDSQCNRTEALDGLFTQLFEPPGSKMALIGSGCSVATEPTAEVSHYFNLTQISCVSSSNELNDRQRFRNYFQLLPTEADIIPIFCAIVKEYGWRKVAIIVQNVNRFTVAMADLKQLLSKDGISYSETSFNNLLDMNALGANIFDNESRIFVVAMFSKSARYLLCKAHALGMKYPKHLFLTYGTYESRWWVPPDDEDVHHLCSPEDRARVLQFSFAALHFNFLMEDNMDTVTETGDDITGRSYLRKYETHLKKPPFYYTPFDYAPHCYDATWTLALALNKTIEELRINKELNQLACEAGGIHGHEFSIEDFSYNNTVVLEALKKHLHAANFTGISGNVTFNENGIRGITKLRVLQYRCGKHSNTTFVSTGALEERLSLVDVAHLSRDDNSTFQYEDGWDSTSIWPTYIPYDGVPNEVAGTVHISVTGTFSVLATAGIIFACVCLVFNFIFRKQKVVQVSSPSLNYLIGVGAIVLYADVFVFVVPTTNPCLVSILCLVSPVMTGLGYSLCYGTIVAKMFRVYCLFYYKPFDRKKKTKIGILYNTWMLALGVLLLVVIDLIILITYTAVEGTRGNLAAQRVPNRENPQRIVEEHFIYNHYIFICDSRARNITLGILYGYKGLLQVFALILAFSIRKVKVKGCDDAKYIAAAVYVTSIVTTVVLVSTYTLNDYINVNAAVFSSGFFLGTTIILSLVFVPKMHILHVDPKGETVFVHNAQSEEARHQLNRRFSLTLVSSMNILGSQSRSGSQPENTSLVISMLSTRVMELESELSRRNQADSRRGSSQDEKTQRRQLSSTCTDSTEQNVSEKHYKALCCCSS